MHSVQSRPSDCSSFHLSCVSRYIEVCLRLFLTIFLFPFSPSRSLNNNGSVCRIFASFGFMAFSFLFPLPSVLRLFRSLPNSVYFSTDRSLHCTERITLLRLNSFLAIPLITSFGFTHSPSRFLKSSRFFFDFCDCRKICAS